MTPVKVMIVDDHYMVIEGIRSLLQQERQVEWLGHATNAASCMALLEKVTPDVLLMDINLPDKNGIDLCKAVIEKHAGVHVIGLSTFNQYSFVQKMINNGASGYVLKNATREELMEAIHCVVKGKQYLSHDTVQMLRSSQSAEKPVLTRREIEVLELIANGLTNLEIAGKLFISTTTVDTHRKNLLSKFGARNTAILIRLAVERNMI